MNAGDENEINYLDMSDEEMMSAKPPAAPAVDEATTQGTDDAGADGTGKTEVPAADGQQDAGAAGGDGGEGEGGAADGAGDGTTKEPVPGQDTNKGVVVDDPNAGKTAEEIAAAATKKAADDAAAGGKDPGKQAGAPTAVAGSNGGAAQQPAKPLKDYTAEEKAKAFDEIMAPFKANGKEIRLDSVEDVQKLKQMGANYTKKLQQLQPQLRMVKMLENNGLLDENKLNHLIDISKGDPLAIQKLLADSQFDPLSVDKDKAADYKPGNHQVGATEIAFEQALDDIAGTSHGAALLSEVHTQWDKESKQVLFQEPQLLLELNRQREVGLYDVINNEVERQKLLGQIPAGTPYIVAYKAMGDMLNAQGKLVVPGSNSQVQEQVPVETRVVPPAKVVDNDDKARAAASTKSGPSGEKTEPDYLAESDEDFLKRMKGRV